MDHEAGEFPKAGTEDARRGLVSNGKKWMTRAEWQVWLNTEHARWLREQGIQPKEKPPEDTEAP